MTDHIDDRRRFKELWKELLIARLAVGILQGCAVGWIVVWAADARLGVAFLAVVFVGCAGILAASSAVAKRGRAVFPLVAGGVLLSQATSIGGCIAAGAFAEALLLAVCGAVVAAIGTLEGLFERSLATVYCGLLGGAAVGALAPVALMRLPWPDIFEVAEWRAVLTVVLFFACLVPICNVGIGLSLALGRLVRDLPRRGPVVTRPMRDDDVPQASRVSAECYRSLAEEMAWSADELAGLLRDCASVEAVRALHSRCTCFVAECGGAGGAVVGYAAVEGNEISELFVRPGYQRRGIGSLLYAMAETAVRSAGHATLTVGTATNAEGFYEKMGAHVARRVEIDRGPLAGRTSTLLEKEL